MCSPHVVSAMLFKPPRYIRYPHIRAVAQQHMYMIFVRLHSDDPDASFAGCFIQVLFHIISSPAEEELLPVFCDKDHMHT